MKTVSEILKITNPTLLFTGNIVDATSEYKQFAKQYHPDLNKNPNANKVFIHIKQLYESAIVMLNNGTWDIPGILLIKAKYTTSAYKIKYYVAHKFELGDMYIGNSIICYLINSKYKKYFYNMTEKLHNIKYKDKKIKDEFEVLMLNFNQSFDTIDNRIGIIINKPKNLLFLKDVLKYYNNSMHPRHVAWILSCLYNLNCFFSLNKLSHNDISIDTCFISPETHSVFILGGWFYSTYFKDKLIGIPKNIFNIIPPDIKIHKQGNSAIDLESIKLLGRTLLGDSTGVKLNKLHNNIDPLIMWLRLPSKRNSIKDYQLYEKVLTDTFGAKKFIHMDLNVEKLYNL